MNDINPYIRRIYEWIELPPVAGVALELHLVRLAPGAPCKGAWFDERGRRWRLIEAARA